MSVRMREHLRNVYIFCMNNSHTYTHVPSHKLCMGCYCYITMRFLCIYFFIGKIDIIKCTSAICFYLSHSLIHCPDGKVYTMMIIYVPFDLYICTGFSRFEKLCCYQLSLSLSLYPPLLPVYSLSWYLCHGPFLPIHT